MSSAMLRVDGAITLWSMGEWTDRFSIENGWTAIDPKWGGMAPKARTPQACLKDALGIRFPKSLVKPLERNEGFAVMTVTPGHDEVVTTTTHAVAVDEHGVITIRRGYSYYLQTEIEEEYRRQSSLIKGAQVASALVACMKELNAVTLRPSGGVYWLPESSLRLWGQLSRVVEGASVGGKNSIYKITHAFDHDSMRAVRDAIMNEARKEASEIMEEVDSGTLGERALKSKAEQADTLKSKIEIYEQILGESLDIAKDIATQAELAASGAKILAVATTA